MDAVLSFLRWNTWRSAGVCVRRAWIVEGRCVLFLVPNIFANTADLVVADHVNHFSAQSLQRLLVDAGFNVREINGEAHNSAWVVVAEKGEGVGVERKRIISQSVHEMAAYWNEFGDRVSAIRESRFRGGGDLWLGLLRHIHSRELGTAGSGCMFPRSKSASTTTSPARQANRIAGSLAGNSAAIVCRA